MVAALQRIVVAGDQLVLERRNPDDVVRIVEGGSAELLDRRGEWRLGDIVGVLLDDVMPLIAQRVLVRRLLQLLESSRAGPRRRGSGRGLAVRPHSAGSNRAFRSPPRPAASNRGSPPQRQSAARDHFFDRALDQRSRLSARRAQSLPHQRRLRRDGERRSGRVSRLGGEPAGVRLVAEARMLAPEIPILQQPAGERVAPPVRRNRAPAPPWRDLAGRESRAAPTAIAASVASPRSSAPATAASPPCFAGEIDRQADRPPSARPRLPRAARTSQPPELRSAK